MAIKIQGETVIYDDETVRVASGTTAERPTPQTGMLRFNTDFDTFEGYDGVAWIDFGSSAQLNTFAFTAVGGETSLSGADDDSKTLAYQPGLVQVYRNGVRLTPGVDYVATTGTSITELAALDAGDIVGIEAFTPFDVADFGTAAFEDSTEFVQVTGDQTIAGEKTFTNTMAVKLPAGLESLQLMGAEDDINYVSAGSFGPTAARGGFVRGRDQTGTVNWIFDARVDNTTRHSYINAGGNFGIGTTSPTSKLHVIGTVQATNFKLVSTGTFASQTVGSSVNNSSLDIDVSSMIGSISQRLASVTVEVVTREANTSSANLTRVLHFRFTEGTGLDVTTISSVGSTAAALTFSRPNETTLRVSCTSFNSFQLRMLRLV